VCPKESEEPPQAQDQPSSSNQASPPTQMRIRLKTMKKMIKKMSHLKERTTIKGEMKLIKTRKMIRVQDRHTQESIKRFKEITP
jgi:hypothetical protein